MKNEKPTLRKKFKLEFIDKNNGVFKIKFSVVLLNPSIKIANTEIIKDKTPIKVNIVNS